MADYCANGWFVAKIRGNPQQSRSIASRSRFVGEKSASDVFWQDEVMAEAIDASTSVLIFDGDCGFCTSSVDLLRRLLPVFPSAEPSQWADLDALGLTVQDTSTRAWLVTPTRQFGGHLAVAALLRHQPDPGLRFLGWLGTVPPWSLFAAAGYALVARFRDRLPGGTPACRIER
jgi:predicted DCC family thiol-disulfide oxidoreductase YuxK